MPYVAYEDMPRDMSELRISRPYLLELAKKLEDFAEKGVFTAEHRWQSVVDAAAALRAIVSETSG